MTLTMGPLSAEQAREVCTWRYPGQYAVYDGEDWEEVCRSGRGLGDETTRQDEFYSLTTEDGVLAGHFRLKNQGRCVTLGIGMAPDFCGKGYGTSAMELAVEEALRRFPGTILWLIVRTFNLRAMRCYRKVGFLPVDFCTINTPSGPTEFLVMQYAPPKQ